MIEAGPELDYSTFSDLSDGQRAAVQAIFEEAFPAWERVPFEELIEGDSDPARVQLAMVDDGAVLGLAVASRLKALPWSFLEYFAITRQRRSQGLGGELWDGLIRHLGASAFPMVLEVEPPELAPAGSAERVTRERRIEFYRRRGAVRLDVPTYRVPHLSGGGGTGELALLAVPMADDSLPSGDELRDLVQTLYVEGYGLPADHPLLKQSLASVEEAAWT